MATGIPKRKPRNDGLGARRRVANAPHLAYEGKAPEGAILATPAAELRQVWSGANPRDNRLYFGENLGVLAALANDTEVCGRIRLVYIDPPFATRGVFQSRNQRHAYDDMIAGAEYLEFLRERLILLREILALDGSIYVHLDDKMVFHAKIMLDEVFGAANFRNCIVRKKCNPKNYTRKAYGNIADFILFYTKSSAYVWNRPVEQWTEARAREYQYIEEETGRRFMKVPVHAPGVRNGETGKAWRGKLPPPGKHWQFSPSTLDELDARGEIYWSPNGNPRRKVYLDASAGIGVQDVWMDFRDAHNQNVCITGYPTEKNPDLLRRIICASSNPGDLVVDSFSGSGTTLAVASELDRRWIGIDNSPEAIGTTIRRFLSGTKRMGDFVGKRGRRPDKLELFSSGDSSGGHRPVSDFAMYCCSDLAAENRDSVGLWSDLLGKQHSGIKSNLRTDVGRDLSE